MQLEDIASHPIISYLGEETNTCLTTTSFQVVLESDKVSPQLPLLQTIQSPAPSATPHKTCSLGISTASLLFFGHAALVQLQAVTNQPEFGSGHVAVDVYRIEAEHVKASCLYN